MKTKDIRPMVKQILLKHPDFQNKGLLVFAKPLNGVLRGFYFEGSDFDSSSFYVWAFVQPLFAPAPTVGFNLGKRLGGGAGKRWNLTQPGVEREVVETITSEGMPFIESATSPETLATWTKHFRHNNDPYVLQAHAYSLAASRQFREAKEAIHSFLSILKNEVPWMLELKSDAQTLLRLIEEDEPGVATLLTRWEHETASRLGIGHR